MSPEKKKFILRFFFVYPATAWICSFLLWSGYRWLFPAETLEPWLFATAMVITYAIVALAMIGELVKILKR